MPAHDRGVGSDRCAIFNDGFEELALALDIRARRVDVGKYGRWAHEDCVTQLDTLVEAYIVLNLATIADIDVRPDHYVLADGAVPADNRAAQDVAEMPYLGASVDAATVVDNCSFMNTDGSTWRVGSLDGSAP